MGQYVNPPYAGSRGDGQGNVGTLGAGYLFGHLNPAGCFADFLTFNYSFYTGIYSDWILFPPTIKNFSIRYPVWANRITISGVYGMSDDNELYFSPYRYIWGNEKLGSYYRNDIGLILSYHIPLSKLTDKLDCYSGLSIKRYWRWWASNRMLGTDYGGGINARTGVYFELKVSANLRFASSIIFQPNSFPWGAYYSFPGLCGGGMGATYYLDLEKNHYVNVSGELILPNNWDLSKTFKFGYGLSYHLPTVKERSIQLGVFSYPYQPYQIYSPVYWTTIGFTYELKYFIVSLAWLDAFNLDKGYKDKSDVAKIISASVDIPIKKNIFSKKKSDEKISFYYPKYKKPKTRTGTVDTLSYYVINNSSVSLNSIYVYANILQSRGMILKKTIFPIQNIEPGKFKLLEIPIEALKGYPSKEYKIKLECSPNPESIITKLFPIQTVAPLLTVKVRGLPHLQNLVYHTPGVARIRVEVTNNGNALAESLMVILPNELEKYLIKKQAIIPIIKPQKTEYVDFVLVFGKQTGSIPLTVNFNEKNGFTPPSYHTTLNLLSSEVVDAALKDIDPFCNSYSDYQEFYIFLKADFSKLSALEMILGNLKPCNYFPGYLKHGPYTTLMEAYENYLSLFSLQIDQSDVFVVRNGSAEPVSRYFISLPNEEINRQKAIDMRILNLYSSKLDAKVLLLGPFKDLLEIKSISEYILINFEGFDIQRLYPMEVNPIEVPKNLKELDNYGNN